MAGHEPLIDCRPQRVRTKSRFLIPSPAWLGDALPRHGRAAEAEIGADVERDGAASECRAHVDRHDLVPRPATLLMMDS